jgi:hypothetical protein
MKTMMFFGIYRTLFPPKITSVKTSSDFRKLETGIVGQVVSSSTVFES